MKRLQRLHERVSEETWPSSLQRRGAVSLALVSRYRWTATSVVAPDGTAWTVSRRREPSDDALDEEDEQRKSFWNSPVGWAISAVAVAAFVVLWILSSIAGLVVAGILLAVELVDRFWRRGGPWLVEATASGAQKGLAWRVAGRRRSAQVVDEVARALERGQADLDPPGAERV